MALEKHRDVACTRFAFWTQWCRLHLLAISFFFLLVAALLAALFELPPVMQQEEISAHATAAHLNEAINRPDKIDLNTAVPAELMCLSGIGQAKADAIVAYRVQHGPFPNVEALDNVSGISEGIILKIQHQVMVSREKE